MESIFLTAALWLALAVVSALIASSLAARSRRPFWGWLADRGLLLVELAAGVALVVILASLWATNRL